MNNLGIARSVIKFRDIAEFRNGLNFSKESHGFGCKLIGVSDFKDKSIPNYGQLSEINPTNIAREEDYLKKNDIIFVRSNGNKELVGRSLYIDKNMPLLFSGFCIRARLVTNKILPLFLAYFVKTDTFKKYISSSSGTNIQNLNQKILGEVIIPLFSKNYQTSIINILFSLDKKIALNNQINQELEAMAKTLYDYWFVQFDFPNEESKPYKSSGGKMVYSEELKKEIPEGWEIKNISDLLPVITGKEDANFAVENGKYPFFTCSDKVIACDTYAFDGKAILVAGNGNFDVKLYEGKFNAYQRTYVLITNDEKYYGLLYFVVKDQISMLTNSSRGSIIKFMTKGDLENIPLVLPKKNHDKMFNQLNTIIEKIEKSREETQKLTQLRDWLLPMLMNGQVSVADAKEQVDELMVAEPAVGYGES